MHSTYLTVTVLAAGANIYAGICDFTRPGWILANIKNLRVQQRWLPTLGVLKILGGLGLLAGIAIPQIGVAAAVGLIVFFVGAIVMVMRARWYVHLPFPVVWLVLAVASLALSLRSA